MNEEAGFAGDSAPLAILGSPDCSEEPADEKLPNATWILSAQSDAVLDVF